MDRTRACLEQHLPSSLALFALEFLPPNSTLIHDVYLRSKAGVGEAYAGMGSSCQLKISCLFGHLELARAALKNKDDDSLDVNSCLKLACDNGHMRLVRLLLDTGDSSLNLELALEIACAAGCEKVLKLLLRRGAQTLKCDSCELEGHAHRKADGSINAIRIQRRRRDACERIWGLLHAVTLEHTKHLRAKRRLTRFP